MPSMSVRLFVVGLACVGAAYSLQISSPAMKDAVANEEKKMVLTDLAEPAYAEKAPKEPIAVVDVEDPLESGMEPTAEESAPVATVVQGPNSPQVAADVKEYKEYNPADFPDIEKLPELPFDLDSIPESKNPEDPCRKIRSLTARWRELGREIAQRTAELVRVRGDERQKVRDQIRRLREDMGKTNALIRENTRECARTRRPTLRPTPPEV